MNAILKYTPALAAALFAAQAAAQVTFYEHTNYQGATFTTDQQIGNLQTSGFNNRASSAVVRGGPWQVCDGVAFSGRCAILREGQYPTFGEMGLNDAISSVRVAGQDARAGDGRAVAAPAVAQPGATQIIFYENEGFTGRSFTTERQVRDFERFGFNNRASSVAVGGERWEVCDGPRFSGRCKVLRPGNYPSLAAIGLNDGVTSVRTVSRDTRIAESRYAPAPAAQARSHVIFHEAEGFGGRSFTTDQQVRNFERFGFNNRASSVEVIGSAWEACDGIGFSGRCVILRPGRYPSLSAMGLNDGVSSVRVASRDAGRSESPHGSTAGYDYRRRSNEQLHQANVTSVRAVVGTPEQRCWVEQEQIPQDRRTANVPAAIAGAVIGGILGHQIGSGTGRDVATVGGAVAGGAIGSQVGRTGAQPARTQDVQRCESVPSAARPDYWDVTYMFRGQEYRMQMTTPPGSTVTVNDRGEPRA
jgi:uncharacterized protein YcfJ